MWCGIAFKYAPAAILDEVRPLIAESKSERDVAAFASHTNRSSATDNRTLLSDLILPVPRQ